MGGWLWGRGGLWLRAGAADLLEDRCQPARDPSPPANTPRSHHAWSFLRNPEREYRRLHRPRPSLPKRLPWVYILAPPPTAGPAGFRTPLASTLPGRPHLSALASQSRP